MFIEHPAVILLFKNNIADLDTHTENNSWRSVAKANFFKHFSAIMQQFQLTEIVEGYKV